MQSPPTGSVSSSPPGRPLRRLSIELILIVLAKIAFFALIWWIVAAHYPRPDTRPAAIEHLLAPSTHSSPETKP
ncbi:cytochrome oxidase putative small subunit CydP [Dyella psychrodurans]|nr:cytochrome oxidase putative small subunit CydP [Dyella psychrodurans]